MFIAFAFHADSWSLVLDHRIISFMQCDCMTTVSTVKCVCVCSCVIKCLSVNLAFVFQVWGQRRNRCLILEDFFPF